MSEKSTASSTPLSSPLLGKKPRSKKGLAEIPTTTSGWCYLRLTSGLTSRGAFRLVMLLALVLGTAVGAVGSVVTWELLFHKGGIAAPLEAWWRRHDPFAPPPRKGERRRLVVHGRDVWVYQPSQAFTSSSPLPVVVVLHGSADTALNMINTTGMDEVAEETGGFLAVYPEMKEAKADSWGFSNASELSFFRAVVDTLGQEYYMRRERVYVCGHSNGGTMSLFLQNNMADLFAGAAAVEGGVGHLWDWNNHSLGRPTMLVWNHNDPVLAEFGGEQLYKDTVSKLRRHDATGVGPSSMEPLPPGAPGTGVLYAQKLSWPSAGSGKENAPPLSVISWASMTPTHHWLNSRTMPGTTLDASRLVWQFFSGLE